MDDDLELLGRWRSGDQKAGKRLFERHFEGLYRFFSSKAAHDVEDLIQATLLACVEKRDRIESFRAYLYGTARHILFGHYGRQNRRFDPAESSLEDLEPGPSQVAAAGHESRLLAGALRRIPLELQVVLELHYWEGLTHPELAEVLDLSVGQVKGKIAAAKKKFKERLAELQAGRGFNALSTIDLEGWASSLARPLS